MNWVRKHLTVESKKRILQLKYERAVSGRGKQTISSVDIYNGVLNSNLSTLSEIEANLG
ncbi:MAG: hypothetical protein AAF702_39840 [Chloroflexota bacterium]